MLIYLGGTLYSSVDAKKSINSQWTREYLNSAKADFSYLKSGEIYWKQGKTYFYFKFDEKGSLEDWKKVVRFTRDFIIKKVASKALIDEDYDKQMNIMIEFHSNMESYSFYCPYYIENTSEDSAISIENNYMFWYLSINNGAETEIKIED